MPPTAPHNDGSTRLALVLASTSPRRAEILRAHGVPFVVEAPSIDDGDLTSGDVSPQQWVASLAHLKARSVVDRLTARGDRGWLVLGADTIVVKEGQIIGQPQDRREAGRIIRTLENGAHAAVTGVALLCEDGRRRLFADEARVRVGKIGDDRIEAYLATDGWRGKAGAYNLQERIDDGWPLECEGDPTTVMGLPMRRLAPMLARLLGAAARGAEGAIA
ncbi:MAG: septum formation protein Maf [Phycisphaerales bacterium]|nr:MAG: septum formation protein Maf [Phycisphaerales bacterium]